MAKKERWYKRQRRRYKEFKLRKVYADLADQLRGALDRCTDDIPVIVVSYNNGIYVENTVRQLAPYGITPIIIDNRSSDAATLNILDELARAGRAHVVLSKWNFGHHVGFRDAVYELLPEVFAYTDPDLQFREDLPRNFLQILADLTREYSVYKAGCALDLLHGETISAATTEIASIDPLTYRKDMSIREWESHFWRLRLAHDSLEMYAAAIDTTFAVYRKSNYIGIFLDGIRVAGSFSVIHMPWFPERDLVSAAERASYLKDNKYSTWVKPDK